MSTIEKLGILGIRSFGPDDGDRQYVKFFKPLTLILGPNGTGKTTIIECLKYAATGDMPPGCKGASSGSFVHDPKLAREREIKAQVKLVIRDVSGSHCAVDRSMVARIKDAKGEKPKMQTLDGVMTRINPNGEKQSITSKCADLNREMIGAMGVSKAVLENVIFCHQEDSNWPLSEGKALKDKFDAIFASTRYTKVLEEIKKLKKNQDCDIREGKKELEYLRQHKQKVEQLNGDLEELKTKLEVSKDSVDNINTQLEPIKSKLNDLNTRYTEICKLSNLCEKSKTERESIQKAIKALAVNIKEPFEGSKQELERELREFSNKVREKKTEQDKMKQEQEDLAAELSQVEKEKSKLFVEIGKLQNEEETYKDNLKRRNGKIVETSEMYNFEEITEETEIDEAMYRKFFERVKGKLTDLMETAKDRKAEFEKEEQKMQDKIDELKATKTKLEHGERMKKETIAKNKEEIKEINNNLKRMASSAGRLTNLASDLKRAEKELATHEASVNVDDIQTEIQGLETKRKDLDSIISDLNAEMVQLHKQSEVQTKLDMLLCNQKDKEESISRLKAEHEESIQSLLGPVPVDDLRETLSNYISTQSDQAKQCGKEVNLSRTKLSTKQAEKTALANQLRKKEDELRELDNKLASVTDGQDLDEMFDEIQKNLAQAQEEKGCLVGAEAMIKKYIRGLERNNPACPLCSRGFQRDEEIRELVIKLKEQLRKVPANLHKAEQDADSLMQRYNEISQLRPVKEAAENLQKREIPEMRAKIGKLENDVKDLKRQMEEKEEEGVILESDLQTAKSIQPDIVDIDRRRGEVRQLQRTIEEQRAALSKAGGGILSGKGMAQVVAEKEEKQLDLETINKTLELRKARLAEHQDKVHKFKSQVQTLQGEKLAIEGELQQRGNLEDRRAGLTSDNANLERDIAEAQVQLKPMEERIQRMVEERSEVTTKKEAMMDEARAEVETVKNKGTGVKNLNNEVKGYIQSGKQKRLEQCQTRQKEINVKQQDREAKQEEIMLRLEDLTEEISSQQMRQRELQDSLEVCIKQEEVAVLNEKIAELQGQLKNLNLRNLEQERQQLLRKETDLTQELHSAIGRQQGFKDQIKATEKELNTDMYKDADKKYSSKIIENKTTEIANGDLQKYYGAMDKAIMMYHKAKMEEINIIMRELWKNTYTGHDIDTIEIQSEAEDASSAGLIKNRRNYNYRVVMIKNGVPIDMRGRCSAGQKVLASLIIRLALAETFCVNCGVFALDEPTTNLDRANIESLAGALSRIIEERSSQKHFQLVVITHDVDFVEILGRAQHMDEYIEVSKNRQGLSQLTMKRVDQLNT